MNAFLIERVFAKQDPGYHPAGTCALGTVLDSRLRVKGVKGLRVADCSVAPIVNNGHTQMLAYGVGEGCAELIKEDARNARNAKETVTGAPKL